MSQANVYASVSNAVWYADKCEIVTGNSTVNYQVYVVQAGNPTVGIVGSVTNASNVMITPNAAQNLVGARFISGPGVANTVTVTSAVNGQQLTLSANASATLSQSQYLSLIHI